MSNNKLSKSYIFIIIAIIVLIILIVASIIVVINNNKSDDIINKVDMESSNQNNVNNNMNNNVNNNDGERNLINEYLNCWNEGNLDKLISLYDINELNKVHQNGSYTKDDIKNKFQSFFSGEREYKFIFGNVFKIENSEDLNVLGDAYKPEQDNMLELAKNYSVYVVEFDLMSGNEYLTQNDWELLVITEENNQYFLAYSGFIDTI